MWPFNTSNKQSKDDTLTDHNLPLPTEIIQTSTGPTSIPHPPSSDQPTRPQSPQPYERIFNSPTTRIAIIGGLTGTIGFLRGIKKGSDIAILCYRAENAHLTPTSKAGWYLYNKSKNYHGFIGGVKNGVKTGGKYFGWSALFVALEGGLDVARGRIFASRREDERGVLRRGQADVLNTVSAAVAVAGIHSWWNGLDRFAAGRMTRSAVRFAVPYGLGQDALAWVKGEPTWYVERISRLVGKEEGESVFKLETR